MKYLNIRVAIPDFNITLLGDIARAVQKIVGDATDQSVEVQYETAPDWDDVAELFRNFENNCRRIMLRYRPKQWERKFQEQREKLRQQLQDIGVPASTLNWSSDHDRETPR